MQWMERDSVSLRKEFVLLAGGQGAHIAQLCRDFGNSRKTGYKWLGWLRRGGRSGMSSDHSNALGGPTVKLRIGLMEWRGRGSESRPAFLPGVWAGERCRCPRGGGIAQRRASPIGGKPERFHE